MNWNVLTSLSSWIPTTVAVGFLMQYQKGGFDHSLEKLKKELQVDVVRFSKWHEKRVAALEIIYAAFSEYLDFLRRGFYFDSRDPLDPMHKFVRRLQDQMLYLDAATAAKISLYQGELLQFWNDAVTSANDPIAVEKVRARLDEEIPGYLPRLQVDINKALDPNYDPASDTARNAIISFYFPSGAASTKP